MPQQGKYLRIINDSFSQGQMQVIFHGFAASIIVNVEMGDAAVLVHGRNDVGRPQQRGRQGRRRKMAVSLKGKDMLTLRDWSAEEIWQVLKTAEQLKMYRKMGQPYQPLLGKSLAMIFTKPSTRTRTSFEAGATIIRTPCLTRRPRMTDAAEARSLRRPLVHVPTKT